MANNNTGGNGLLALSAALGGLSLLLRVAQKRRKKPCYTATIRQQYNARLDKVITLRTFTVTGEYDDD